MIGLTLRQRELLVYLRERETCPSYREIIAALGWQSIGTLTRVLNGLEERGCIRRLRRRARAIEVIAHFSKPVVIDGEAYRFIPKTRAADNCVAGAKGPCKLCSDTSAASARMKALHADRMAWCPPEMIEDYRLLARHLGAGEARAVIEGYLRREETA